MVRRKGVPELNELVICTVKKITPFAVWCTLEEYPEAEGMIHISEVSGKWVRDIRNFVKQDKRYIAKVVRVEGEKNAVNLSLKRVSKYDEKDKLNAYRKAQRAEKILEMAGKELNKRLDQAYGEVGYKIQEKFGELFVAFEEIRKSPNVLDDLNVPKEWAEALMKIIERSFVEKEVILKADIEVKTYASDGIKRIRDLLKELKERTRANISYMSAPKYRLVLKTKNPKDDERKIRLHLDNMAEDFKKADVEFGYKFVK